MRRRSTLLVVALLGSGVLAWLALTSGERGTLQRSRATGGAASVAPEGAPELPGAPATAEREARRAAGEAAPQPDPATGSDDSALRVVGRVVGADGSALAGARVLGAALGAWGGVPLDVEPRADERDWRRVETLTEADGRFALTGLAGGDARLAVRAEGRAPLDVAHVVLPTTGEHDVGDLVLDAGLVLAGRVKNPAGVGLSGARIAREAPSSGWGRPRFVHLTTTEADGTFRTPAIAPGEWKLRVEHAAHPAGWFEGADYAAGVSDGHVLELEPAWSIAGRLEVPGLADLSGYSVALQLAHKEEPYASWPTEHRYQTTDCAADGAFEFDRVRAVDATTRYVLEPRRLSGRLVRRVGEKVEVTAGRRDVVLLGEALAGLAFELWADGAPVADPQVFLVVAGGNHVDLTARGSVEALGDGRYRIGDIAQAAQSESFSLRVQKEGYRDLHRARLGLAPGEERDLGRLELEPARFVNVRVTDAATGAPLAGVTVQRDSRDAPHFGRDPEAPETASYDVKTLKAETDGRGRARLPVVLGHPNQVGAFLDGYAAAISAPFDGDTAPDEVALELARGATLRVRVEDAQGRPVVGEGVQVDLRELRASMTAFNSFSAGAAQTWVSTGPDGVALFEHLAPGGAVVSLNEMRPGEEEELVLTPDGEHELVLVARSHLAVDVTVLEAGVPLVGAEVVLVVTEEADAEGRRLPFLNGLELARGTTGASGRVRLENADAGDHDLVVRHGTRDLPVVHPVRIEPDVALVVDLGSAGAEGSVASPTGAPLAGTAVFVLSSRYVDTAVLSNLLDDARDPAEVASRNGAGHATTAADGTYRLRGLAVEEPLVVAALPPGGQLVLSQPFTLRASETRRLAPLVGAPAGRLTLRVDAEPGLRAGLKLELALRDPGTTRPAQRVLYPGRDGEGALDHLAPGTWDVRLLRSFFASELLAERTVEVAAGETVAVTFRLDAPR